MTDDKIAEIRARHSRDDHWRNSPSMISPQSHDDRATLLAEVARLNKDLATQQGCCDGAAAQDAHVRQERAEHKAEIEKLRADRRERIATAALQGILACQEGNTALPKEWPGIFAIMSVNCADALIAKLDKEEGKP